MRPTERLILEKYEGKGFKGLKKGFSDFIFYKNLSNNPEIYFVEVKTIGGILSKEQKVFAEIINSLRLNYKLEILGQRKFLPIRKIPTEKNKNNFMKPKEKLILRFLKEHGRSSTTKIAAAINSDMWRARKYLDGLKDQGKIICKEETNAVYWSIKEEKKE